MIRIFIVAVFTCLASMCLAGELFKVFQADGHPGIGLVAALFVMAFGAMIALGNGAMSIVERLDRQEARDVETN